MADPRTTSTPLNVNEQIFDANVRHRIGLERLSTQIRNQVIAVLNQADQDLVDKLALRLLRIKERGFDTGQATTERLDQLLKDIRALNKEAHTAAQKELVGELQDLAQYEMDFQTRTINAAAPVELSLTKPAVSVLKAVVTDDPFQGKIMSEWVSELSEAKYRALRDKIRVGIVEGQTVDDMVRGIRGTRAAGYRDGILEISRRQAETWVRTAVTHTTSRAREILFDENTNVIKGVMWVSTLDGRTSLICQARDGQVYPVNSGPRPPAHPNCRSTTTPILRSANDIGISKKALPPGTRASMGGQVPGDLTYQQWLARQDKGFIQDVLGPSRADLFLKGDVSLDKFVRDDGSVLTLEQLKKTESKAFDKAGL